MKCPNCGWSDHISSEERGRRIKAGHARTDKKIGRPLSTDHKEIVRLRKKGMSLSKIAERVGASRGGVQYAIKQNKIRVHVP